MRHYNIPVFVPHKGCPHDCIFCNQHKITGFDDEVTAQYVKNTVNEYLKSFPETDRTVEIAFFGGSFTAIPVEMQTELLEAAYEFVYDGRVDGIRCSTRPDAISPEILDNLKKYGVKVIELGVQSMCEDVLKKSNRGYIPEVVEESSRLIKSYGCFSLGLQMMTGLPLDTDDKALYTCGKICSLKPDFVRIYPTLVVQNTALEVMYKNGIYNPQELDDAVRLCAHLKRRFTEKGIKVIRVSLQTTEEISPGGAVVAGPFHPAFGELVDNEIFFDKMQKLIPYAAVQAVFSVNSRDLSKAVGNGRRNILKFSESGVRVKISPDDSVSKNTVRLLEVK